MPWFETWDLTLALIADPASRVATAVAGWSHPTSPESLVLADLYDLTHKGLAGKKKATPYPRPWDPRPTRFGRATRPQAEIRAILASRGHGVTPLLTRDARGRLHDARGRYRKG